MQYAPQSPDEPVHARFVEACRNLDQTEYYLDILCAGDSHERAEVVQQQMSDGKLDRLRQRLEKIHEEEIEDGYDRTNEIKSYIVRQGMTMQEVVDLLRDEHGWSDSVSNLSNKLQRESLRYVEAVQLADALGFEIVWQRRK